VCLCGFGLSPNGNHDNHVGPPAESPIRLREQLPATVESVAAARRAVRSFASELEVDLDGMVLAVSEAVANAVAHADDGEGSVELSASASPSEVTVRVGYLGGGLDAVTVHGAGFGIEVIRRLAQSVELEDREPGVQLTMHFLRGGGWSLH